MPSRSTTGSVGNGYKTLAEHLTRFHALGHIPIGLNIHSLDDGDGIEMTMTTRQAFWHKTCRLQCNQTKLVRLVKKVAQREDKIEVSLGMQTRSSHGLADLKEIRCFFCNELAGSTVLHNASTYEIGDMIALEAKYHSRCLASL